MFMGRFELKGAGWLVDRKACVDPGFEVVDTEAGQRG